MKMLSRAVLRGRPPVLLGLAALTALFLAPAARAAAVITTTAPPRFTEDHGPIVKRLRHP
ncbi:hypothetical protein ACFY8B_28870 [Streptomyces sp. NPDC012751]|uniref:hypothetical protein n=1 Tax=Streptomyces sp. NPDC012751 TaxID=3364846 RepID=UPI0036A2BBF4